MFVVTRPTMPASGAIAAYVAAAPKWFALLEQDDAHVVEPRAVDGLFHRAFGDHLAHAVVAVCERECACVFDDAEIRRRIRPA